MAIWTKASSSGVQQRRTSIQLSWSERTTVIHRLVDASIQFSGPLGPIELEFDTQAPEGASIADTDRLLNILLNEPRQTPL